MVVFLEIFKFRLRTGKKHACFFLHGNFPNLSVFGGMFLFPAPFGPVWKGDGDFCGRVGRV